VIELSIVVDHKYSHCLILQRIIMIYFLATA
jgi:hypothetical protein